MTDRDTPVPPPPPPNQIKVTSRSQEMAALVSEATRPTPSQGTSSMHRLGELRRKTALEFAERVAANGTGDVRDLARAMIFLIHSLEP